MATPPSRPGGSRTFPGPTSAAMIEQMRRYVITQVHPFVVDLAGCDGMWLATVDGDRLFDWSGYYASKLIGHNHPGLQEPDYLQRLALAANNKVANPDFLTRECLEYYHTLHTVAPRCMCTPALEVYTVNSGAEAIENMMKYFINLYHQRSGGRRKQGEKCRFLYFEQAFHGRTVFALNVTQTSDPVVTKDFQGLLPGNLQLPFPEVNNSQSAEQNRVRTNDALQMIEALLGKHAGEVVGIVVEPIQGAGGHRAAEPHFFRGLSELAHRHEVFLGFDEVQTAGGPTGDLFMVDQLELPHPPQAIATAKKFGNGVVYMLHPMEDRGVLDSTWGGSLVDMVRFVQEMKIVEREGLIRAARTNGEQLAAGLRQLESDFPDLLSNVRGLGLYQGFSLATSGLRDQLEKIALHEEHLLLLPAGANSIRTRPNLSVTTEEVDRFIAMLGRCFRRLQP